MHSHKIDNDIIWCGIDANSFSLWPGLAFHLSIAFVCINFQLVHKFIVDSSNTQNERPSIYIHCIYFISMYICWNERLVEYKFGEFFWCISCAIQIYYLICLLFQWCTVETVEYILCVRMIDRCVVVQCQYVQCTCNAISLYFSIYLFNRYCFNICNAMSKFPLVYIWNLH